MSLWSNFRAGISALAGRLTTSSRQFGARVFRRNTRAGVYVDAEAALRNATVWACVQYLSRTVAQVPWRVMREDPKLGCVLAPTHPADWLLNKRPNPEMGAFAFRETMTAWRVLYGNAYAEIEWDNRGAPYALWPLHPDRVRPRRDSYGTLVYDVHNDAGGMVTLDAADMYHVRGYGDGPVGKSVIEYAAESIGWAKATELFGSTFFGKGMNPSGFVTTTATLSVAAQDELRKELNKLYAGPAGEATVILDKGMSFVKSSTAPNDAQFIETRQHQIEETCRWFGVPPHKVMHLLNAHFDNLESQSTEVVVDNITPIAKSFEEEADYKLFGPQNRGGFYTKMNLRGLMRGDSAGRAAFYTALFNVGGLTINKILSLEDENPIGPDGDVRFVPANMMTLQRAIALGETTVTPAGQQDKPVPAPAPGAADPAPEPDPKKDDGD